MLMTIAILIQTAFTIVVGMYFYSLLRNQKGGKNILNRTSGKEMEKLRKMREIKLTEPFSEKVRPIGMKDIVGQKDGIKALRAALCSSNPQHVIIYGPPGVGKTAAARIILNEAKALEYCPFGLEAKFIEIDATTLRFDERGIADPLMGSVHDPIYQGAGAYGIAGIPQPKPGAVSKAHGGILFLDEIGELHSIQMNKLLKVLEDRKVYFESSYYNSEDANIPTHIHDIFQKGLPADFRLVGATTRSPEEIPAALRSRCVEIYFNRLFSSDVMNIAKNAIDKCGLTSEVQVPELVSRFAYNGRDAVNIIQTASSISRLENRKEITCSDVEWVLEYGKYEVRIDKKINSESRIGRVNALAVIGTNSGLVFEIEATATACKKGEGDIKVSGIAESEEVDGRGRRYKKTGSSLASVDNAITVLKRELGIDFKCYNLHLNFHGGNIVDGPSAGLSTALVIASAVLGLPVKGDIAMTGELSICGKILPVGGVATKLEAAAIAGVKKVLIPEDNYLKSYNRGDYEIIPVCEFSHALEVVFGSEIHENGITSYIGSGNRDNDPVWEAYTG
jgi:Lon-like ATP-dependent protease